MGVEKPPPTPESAAARTQQEVARPRCLLRSHRKQPYALAAAVRGGEAVAEMALTAQPWQQPELGEIPSNAKDISIVASTNYSLQTVAKPRP